MQLLPVDSGCLANSINIGRRRRNPPLIVTSQLFHLAVHERHVHVFAGRTVWEQWGWGRGDVLAVTVRTVQ